MPSNPQNTISQTALKWHNKYKRVTTEALSHVSIVDSEGRNSKVHTLTSHKQKLLDFIEVDIVKLKAPLNLPIVVNKGTFSRINAPLTYEQIHRRLMHVCEKKIEEMCRRGIMEGLKTETKERIQPQNL